MGRKAIKIMKFGGTSVADPERIRKVAAHAIEAGRQVKVIVVVSARGDETAQLKKIARETCQEKPPGEELDKMLATGEIASAALIAMAIHSKEFDGVHTANPRVIPRARRFDRISHHLMLQLADAGAEVLMSRAVLLAYNCGVEIQALLSPSIGKSSGGTLVCSGSTDEDIEGITWTQPGLVIQRKALIDVSGLPNKPNVMSRLEDAIDGIKMGPAMQSGADKKAIISYLCSLDDLPAAISNLYFIKLGKVEEREVAALTLVHPLPETANCRARCGRVLGKVGVNIEALSESGPVMVAVKWKSLKKAAHALAKEFDLLA